MLKRMILLVCCLALMLPMMTAFAESDVEADSEFDFSEEQKKVEELGIPTVNSVAELKAKAVAEFLAQQQAQTDNAAPAEKPQSAPTEEKKEPKEEKPAETGEISEEDKARIIAEYMAKQAEALHKKDAEQADQ